MKACDCKITAFEEDNTLIKYPYFFKEPLFQFISLCDRMPLELCDSSVRGITTELQQ